MVLHVVISSDGRLVATSDDEDRTRIWAVRSGRRLHTLEVNETPSMFSPDSALFLSSILNGGARIWDVASGRLLNTLDRAILVPNAHPAFSPSSRL